MSGDLLVKTPPYLKITLSSLLFFSSIGKPDLSKWSNFPGTRIFFAWNNVGSQKGTVCIWQSTMRALVLSRSQDQRRKNSWSGWKITSKSCSILMSLRKFLGSCLVLKKWIWFNLDSLLSPYIFERVLSQSFFSHHIFRENCFFVVNCTEKSMILVLSRREVNISDSLVSVLSCTIN